MIDLNFAILIVRTLGAVISRQGGRIGDSIELDHYDLIQLFEHYSPQNIEEALKYVASRNITVCDIEYNVEVKNVGNSYIIKLV
jgi:hypothetical protein